LHATLKAKEKLRYLDNGCSRNMIGDASKFVNLTLKSEGFVTYSDNNRGRILGKGDIKDNSSIIIHNILYVEGLKHNLFIISQLCDRGHKGILNQVMKVCKMSSGILNRLIKI